MQSTVLSPWAACLDRWIKASHPQTTYPTAELCRKIYSYIQQVEHALHRVCSRWRQNNPTKEVNTHGNIGDTAAEGDIGLVPEK